MAAAGLLRRAVRELLRESHESSEFFSERLERLVRSRKGSRVRRDVVDEIVAFGLEPLEHRSGSVIDVTMFWDLLASMLEFVGLDPDELRSAADAWSDWNDKGPKQPTPAQEAMGDALETRADSLRGEATRRLVHDLDSRAFGRMLIDQRKADEFDWRPNETVPEDHLAL